jgi:hypothetical protein
MLFFLQRLAVLYIILRAAGLLLDYYFPLGRKR